MLPLRWTVHGDSTARTPALLLPLPPTHISTMLTRRKACCGKRHRCPQRWSTCALSDAGGRCLLWEMPPDLIVLQRAGLVR